MEPNPAGLGPLEGIGERGEDLGGAQPGVTVTGIRGVQLTGVFLVGASPGTVSA